MRIYLEILRHSGPGRLGRLHINAQKVLTPNFFHFTNQPGKHDLYIATEDSKTKKKPVVVDYNFFTLAESSNIKNSNLCLLPDFTVGFDVPLAMAKDALKETIRVARDHPEHGVVIPATKYPELVEDVLNQMGRRPLLVISGGEKLASKPRLLVEVLTRVRENSSPNTALYYPLAPPAMIPVLAYMGADLFDSAYAVLAAARGEYLTSNGVRTLTGIGELPCTCSICRNRSPEMLKSDSNSLLKHNLAVLKALFAEIRERMRVDTFREMVEERAAASSRAMAALRILSIEKKNYLERYTPVTSSAPQRYITHESYYRPEVVRWHHRMKTRYSPPKGIKLTVILPCSARKPYSKSRSHRLFRRFISKGAGSKRSLIHEVVLTSPLGLVPRELEGVFPASSYDIPVTGHWSDEEKNVVKELLTDYLNKSETYALAYVDGVYREICAEIGVELGNEKLLFKDSLELFSKRISAILSEFEEAGKSDGDRIGKGICDYQFGSGAWEYLLPEGSVRRGRAFFFNGEQTAAINPTTGLLALTLKGGEMLSNYGRYIVRAALKPPSDSLFCVGVEDADEIIRPGDEVIITYKDEVVGVGRAVLSGLEMKEAEHGLAVKLRHRR